MNHGRQVGVRIPDNQSTEQAPVMTVTNVALVQLALVEYGDERGHKRTTLAVIAGGKAHPFPNGEALTASFRPFNSKINEQIQEKIAVLTPAAIAQVPQRDVVDVLGGPTQTQLDAAEDALRDG